MGAEITPPFMQGICVPWAMSRSHLWASESDYTQQSPLVGPAEAQQPSVLRLETSGSQSDAGSLTVQTQRAGHPGPEGASFIWKNAADSGTAWRGRDIQQLSAIETVRHTTTSGVTSATQLDAESIPDGSTFVVYRFNDGSTNSVRVSWRRPGVSSWTEIVIQENADSGSWPAIAYNPLNGAIYVFHWVDDSVAGLAQVRTHRLTYTASSDSWASKVVSRWALQTPLNSTDPTNGWILNRLRAAFNAGGQCLLVGWVTTRNTGISGSYREGVVQYASTSEGGRFEQVSLGLIADGVNDLSFSHHSVMAYNGRFYVAWPAQISGLPTDSVFFIAPLPHAYVNIRTFASNIVGINVSGDAFAFLPASGGTPVIVVSSKLVGSGACSVWVDEDGTFRLAALVQIAPDQDNGTGMVFMMQSTDAGKSWKYVGDGDRTNNHSGDATMYDGIDGDIYPTEFVCVSQMGRQVMFTNHVAPDAATDLSIHAVYFGGYSTLEMPGRVDAPFTYQRHYWTFTWLPFEQPEFYATIGASGSGTDVLNINGLQVITSSGTRYYTHTITGDSIANGITFKVGYIPNSGGGSLTTLDRGFTIRSADGVNDYRVHVRITDTGFRAVDHFSGATRAEVTGLSGALEIMVALQGAKVSVWYRTWTADPDRIWINATSGAVVTDNPGAAAGSSEIDVGHIASATVNTTFYYWAYDVKGSAARLASGQTNPTDLIGRDYPRRGRAVGVDDGVRISTLDGSAREGEQYQIDATARHPIERIFFSTSPTPRVQWRSDAVTSGDVAQTDVAFKLNDAEDPVSSVDDGKLGNELGFLYLDGINFSDFLIQGYTGGAWVTLATVDTAISGDADLRNNSLYGDDSTRAAYFSADELVGWTARVNSQINVKITRNSPGFFGGSSNAYKQAVCRVEGATGDAYSGATELIPPRCLVLFQLKDTRYRGFRLRISAQETYTKDFRIGTLLLGHVQILATPTSRGRIIEQIPGTITEDDAAGVRRWVDIDPGGQFLRIAWVDPVDVSPFTGTQTTDADYYEGSSVLGSRQPIAAAWENQGHSSVPFDLQGLFSAQGAGNPVIYVPRIVKATQGSEETRVYARQQQFFFGQLDGSVQIESVLGDELEGLVDGTARDEWLRVATLPLRGVR